MLVTWCSFTWFANKNEQRENPERDKTVRIAAVTLWAVAVRNATVATRSRHVSCCVPRRSLCNVPGLPFADAFALTRRPRSDCLRRVERLHTSTSYARGWFDSKGYTERRGVNFEKKATGFLTEHMTQYYNYKSDFASPRVSNSEQGTADKWRRVNDGYVADGVADVCHDQHNSVAADNSRS